jgi:hypothetical protein
MIMEPHTLARSLRELQLHMSMEAQLACASLAFEQVA